MTPTEEVLAQTYGPLIPLEAICKEYFGLSYAEACRAASTNDLPIPTFRLRKSNKAPVVVKFTALAAWIDKTAQDAEDEWRKSQV